MSRLDELITELCPDGVKYKKIGECCSLVKGNTPIQKATPGEYPLVVTTSERKTCSTFQFDQPSVCIPLVSSRGHGVASLNEIYYQDGKFAVGNILCCVTPIDQKQLSARFLYVFLNYAKDWLLVPKMQGGANVSLSVDSISRTRIPVPPLPVQQEIVRILDHFTQLIAELNAELTARKKQYEYYANTLLHFPNAPYYALAELCDIVDYRGKTPKKSDEGVFLVTAKNIRQGYIDYEKSQEYIPVEIYDDVMHRGLPQIGDVLITTEAPCGFVAQVDRIDIALAQRVIKYRPKTNALDSSYLKYILLGSEFQDKLQSAATGGTVKGIKGSTLHRLTIPVPSIDVQHRVVDNMNKFNELCTHLTSGLPAEIAARQKQYEYYRDKLLTFKELPKS